MALTTSVFFPQANSKVALHENCVSASINCNSRLLRLYERFMDPPGEARPDWAIMKGVAQAMERRYRRAGRSDDAARCRGFDWKTDEDVFLAGGRSFPDNRVDTAQAEGLPAECYRGVDYALLKKLGQEGLQTPVRKDPKSGRLVGTKRRYGERFATEGDTEVILAAWQRWGVDCLARLDGMFAFALYDLEKRQLFLARDRFGVKPLFLAELPDGTLAFGSELKALLTEPSLSRTLNQIG